MSVSSEMAREIVEKYVTPFIAVGHANCLYSDVSGDARKAIAKAIAQAFANGKKFEREECAKVAEKTCKFDGQDCHCFVHVTVAEAIRSRGGKNV